jgi:hypothetical protein
MNLEKGFTTLLDPDWIAELYLKSQDIDNFKRGTCLDTSVAIQAQDKGWDPAF